MDRVNIKDFVLKVKSTNKDNEADDPIFGANSSKVIRQVVERKKPLGFKHRLAKSSVSNNDLFKQGGKAVKKLANIRQLGHILSKFPPSVICTKSRGNGVQSEGNFMLE